MLNALAYLWLNTYPCCTKKLMFAVKHDQCCHAAPLPNLPCNGWVIISTVELLCTDTLMEKLPFGSLRPQAGPPQRCSVIHSAKSRSSSAAQHCAARPHSSTGSAHVAS